jgi:hypothetical protein
MGLHHTRRGVFVFLGGLIAAPAIVRACGIMRVKALLDETAVTTFMAAGNS